jgi:hypothetical protein
MPLRSRPPTWSAAALNHPGQVRVDKVFTLAQSLAVRTFGRVKGHVLDRIRALLQDLTADRP